MTLPARSLLPALATLLALHAQPGNRAAADEPTPAETGLSPLSPRTEAPAAPATPPAPPSPVAAILAAPAPVVPFAEPLKIEAAIARALEANFDVQLQRLTTTATSDTVEIARSDYDPTLTASASTGQSQSTRATVDANGNILPVPGTRSDDENARLSLSQKIPLGATITGTTRLNRNERTQASSSTLNPAYNSDVGLSVRQPLLKGAGTSINNAALERARLGTARARADFAAQVFTVVRDVEVAYSNLALAREQVGIRSFSLEVRKKLYEENRARREAGVATDLEVLQAEVGVATAARDLLLARQTARDREDELLRLLGQETFENPVGPVALPPINEPVIDLAASLARARANTPEYASALASIRQQEIDVASAKNARLPQLDLGAQAGYNSTDATAKDATTNLWSGDGYNWQVDLSLSFPWGFREERARLRQARAGRDREELRLAQIEQQILVSVRNAVRALETGAENLRLSTLAAQLSGREYEVEKARYDSGLSTFRRVQETQEAFDQAKLSELQAKVSLRTAQANLDRLEGNAAERYRITLAP
jgi:outer membrane protein TolC